MIYVTATARILYAMSRIGYVPKFLSQLNRQRFPVWAIVVNFVLGMFSFLPLPGWQAMVNFLVSAIVITYAMGPIALMCIRRTIAEGKFHGIASGLGVATGDAFYAAVAVLGLTAISGFIITNQFIFRILASILLVIIGARIFISVPPEVCAKKEEGSFLKDYISMLAIDLANPLTVLFFVGILPGLGIFFSGASPMTSMAFVFGIFSGSTIWWLFLCGVLGSVRSCISADTLRLVNKISGVMIACLGVGLLVYAVMFR